MGEKTYAKLCQDPQLLLYYYAARHLFPEEKQIILSIFFIRDGGPFSICLDDLDVRKMERLLQRRFYEIRNSKQPRMCDTRQKNMKCKYLCPFSKHKFDDNDEHNMCRTAHDHIKKYGIDYTTYELTKPGFVIGTYDAPG